MKRLGCCIYTFTGFAFYPLDPRPEDIYIRDIAHALSLQCRFAGHVKKFYSVAEHSWRASLLLPGAHSLWGLLHDAPEAYMTDLPSALKHSNLGRGFRLAEKNIMRAICLRFGLPVTVPPCVKFVDEVLCVTELRDLLGQPTFPTNIRSKPSHHMVQGPPSHRMVHGKPLPGKIYPLSSHRAEKVFLDRFYEYRPKP